MNMIKSSWRAKGFTLIELILVMVIISIIIYASIGYMQQRAMQVRVDRTAAQMQQIMNAALAYYVANGDWPASVNQMQDGYYLPPNGVVRNITPWGYDIIIKPNTPPTGVPKSLWIWTTITGTPGAGGLTTAMGAAEAIKSTLPFSYTTSVDGAPPSGPACVATTTTCYVVALLNIPGQNLNNASAVNFAGVYHHGGCVPVPQCPVDASNTPMKPQIMVVPVSVSGLNDPINAGVTPNAYPISSFTAFATSNTGAGNTPSNTSPPFCNSNNYIWPGGPGAQNCTANPLNPPSPAATAYWRVCLQVTTSKGNVEQTNNASTVQAWGRYVTLLAITRCAITNESSGSTFGVYSN